MSTSRLLVHVQKGWEDGLFVTCVASCDDLWAIVMDAGTEYSQQIYKVHPNSFLPKVSSGLAGWCALGLGPGSGSGSSVFVPGSSLPPLNCTGGVQHPSCQR